MPITQTILSWTEQKYRLIAESDIALSGMWPSVAGTYQVLIELSADDDENSGLQPMPVFTIFGV